MLDVLTDSAGVEALLKEMPRSAQRGMRRALSKHVTRLRRVLRKKYLSGGSGLNVKSKGFKKSYRQKLLGKPGDKRMPAIHVYNPVPWIKVHEQGKPVSRKGQGTANYPKRTDFFGEVDRQMPALIPWIVQELDVEIEKETAKARRIRSRQARRAVKRVILG